MSMSTPILAEAARLLEANILLDSVQIYDVGDPITVGINVTRPLTPVGPPVAGLVQAVTLENAVESRATQTFAIKVGLSTPLEAGQAVKVLNTRTDFSLVGKTILVDKVSKNGAAMLRKATGTDFEVINQEGKGGLA